VYALFTRLERYVFVALATLALWAAVAVAVPAVAQAQAAQAQEKAPNDKAGTLAAAERPVVVVDPGDTLWSISSKELGPNAAPWLVARGVERIYALNREQIGPDPNVLFPGQRLSVPPALSGTPQATEPSASRRSVGTEPPARKAAEAASADDRAGRQAQHETLGAPRQAAAEVRGEDGVAPEAASKPAPLPDAARAAPVPAARPPAAEEPPRSPGESFSFVGEARAAVAGAASALVGLFPSGEDAEGYTWRELLGAALLAVSSVAFVLAFVLAFAVVSPQQRARRSQQEDWWREVHANSRAYERAYEELQNGKTGAHARTSGSRTNGSHANGKDPVEVILAAERKRGRLRRHGRPRRGRPRSTARHVRRGLAHGAYAPGIRRLLRDASGNGSRRPASRASASSGRFSAEPRRTGVRGR
jgi:hypothetical protein